MAGLEALKPVREAGSVSAAGGGGEAEWCSGTTRIGAGLARDGPGEGLGVALHLNEQASPRFLVGSEWVGSGITGRRGIFGADGS